jgi:hypothetical protein
LAVFRIALLRVTSTWPGASRPARLHSDRAYREGQEDQLGALGLVLNAIVVWNTRYMGLALDDLRGDGLPINPEDVERLSPLVHIHLNGRYTFTLPEPLAHGQLRPLRDPNDPAEQVFDLMAASA